MPARPPGRQVDAAPIPVASAISNVTAASRRGSRSSSAPRQAVREAVLAGLGVGTVFAKELVRDPRLRAVGVDGSGLGAAVSLACLPERRELRAVRAFFALAGARRRRLACSGWQGRHAADAARPAQAAAGEARLLAGAGGNSRRTARPGGCRRARGRAPCSLATAWTRLRPRPLPEVERVASRRTKRSRTRSRSFGGIPGPVSATTSAGPRGPSSTARRTAPPDGVYLIALSSRLASACASR